MTATPGLRWNARVTTLDNRTLADTRGTLTAVANGVTAGPVLDLAPLMAQGPVLVALSLTGPDGRVVSTNVYWRAANDAAFRAMDTMPKAAVTMSATSQRGSNDTRVTVELFNGAPVAALATKLTLLTADGTRVLPAFYSDNYVSLLPGEHRSVTIDVPGKIAAKIDSVALRGWNAHPTTAQVPATSIGVRP